MSEDRSSDCEIVPHEDETQYRLEGFQSDSVGLEEFIDPGRSHEALGSQTTQATNPTPHIGSQELAGTFPKSQRR